MCIPICKENGWIIVPQEVTNENAITLVYYKNCDTLCNTMDGLINAHLCN